MFSRAKNLFNRKGAAKQRSASAEVKSNTSASSPNPAEALLSDLPSVPSEPQLKRQDPHAFDESASPSKTKSRRSANKGGSLRMPSFRKESNAEQNLTPAENVSAVAPMTVSERGSTIDARADRKAASFEDSLAPKAEPSSPSADAKGRLAAKPMAVSLEPWSLHATPLANVTQASPFEDSLAPKSQPSSPNADAKGRLAAKPMSLSLEPQSLLAAPMADATEVKPVSELLPPMPPDPDPPPPESVDPKPFPRSPARSSAPEMLSPKSPMRAQNEESSLPTPESQLVPPKPPEPPPAAPPLPDDSVPLSQASAARQAMGKVGREEPSSDLMAAPLVLSPDHQAIQPIAAVSELSPCAPAHPSAGALMSSMSEQQFASSPQPKPRPKRPQSTGGNDPSTPTRSHRPSRLRKQLTPMSVAKPPPLRLDDDGECSAIESLAPPLPEAQLVSSSADIVKCANSQHYDISQDGPQVFDLTEEDASPHGGANSSQNAVQAEPPHVFLDSAQAHRWKEVADMIREQQSLVKSTRLVDNWTALHYAADAGDGNAVAFLLRSHADFDARSHDGLRPLDVAKAGPARSLLEQYGNRRLHRGSGGRGGARLESHTIEFRVYERHLASAVCVFPLIGDRHKREPIIPATRQIVSMGLLQESKNIRNEAVSLREKGRHTDADLHEKGWDLVEALAPRFQDESIDLRELVIESYTLESWLHATVSRAVLHRDDSRKGLAPYTRLLHDVLSETTEKLPRWSGKCWRWLKLADVQSQCSIDTITPIRNLVSFPGFVSASRDATSTWEDLRTFAGSNVLVVFTQDPGQGPADISALSAYPHEHEVIYPLGQQFWIRKVEEWGMTEFQAELGDAGAFNDGAMPKTVIHLQAADAFYDIAGDLYKGSGATGAAIPILEARLDYERRIDGEVQRALLYLGRARKESGDLEGAERNMLDAKRLRIEQGTLRTLDGAGLLMSIGMVHFDQCKFEDALVQYSEAKAIFVETHNLQSAAGAMLMASTGAAQRALQDVEAALSSMLESERIHVAIGSLRSPAGAALIAGIARIYSELEDYDRALEEYVRAKELTEATGSMRTPSGGVLMTSIGTFKHVMGDYLGALTAYEEARQILIATRTLNTPGGAALLTSIGVSKHASGDLIGSFVAHKESIHLHRTLGLRDAPYGQFTFAQLELVANACLHNGILEKAQDAWEDHQKRDAELPCM